MPKVLANSVGLYYEERGSGPAMIWAHGLGQNCGDWDELMAYFGDRYRVVAYDARGHGRSDLLENADAYSQELMVEDMAGLLDTLGIAEAIVAGHSMGANVALNFALQRPERCIAAIPVAIGSGSSDVARWNKYYHKLADLLEVEGTAAYLDELNSIPAWASAMAHPRIGERVRRSELANAPHALANVIRGVQARRPSVFDLQPKLETLSVPVLVMLSTGDEPVVECSKFLVHHLPNATLAEISARSHWTHLEAADVFHQSIDRFLDALG